MKRKTAIALPSTAAFMLACGGIALPAPETTLAAVATVLPFAPGAVPAQLDGQQILETKCVSCHDLGGVDALRASADAGAIREVVLNMLAYGAELTNAEVDTLVAYLAAGGQSEAPVVDASAGADLVNAQCTTCHDLTGIEPGLYAADEWRETVSRMMGYGLVLSEDEFETVVAYLGSTPEVDAESEAPAVDVAAAADLVNTRCTTCHDLTGIEPGFFTADEWRETVSRMMGYGVVLTEEEFETIVTYLGSTPEAEAEGGAADFDAAAAEDLLNTACTTCHDLSAITSAPGAFTEDDFRETIFRMLGYGLFLEDDQIEMLVRYLTETYGAP